MISEIALNFLSNSNFSSKGGGDGVCWGWGLMEISTNSEGRVYWSSSFKKKICDFLGVRFTLDYDYMCSEPDFTKEKKIIFIRLLEPPIPTAATLSQNGRIAI